MSPLDMRLSGTGNAGAGKQDESSRPARPRPRTAMARRTAWLTLAAIALMAALLAMLRPQPVAVDLAAVAAGPMRVTVDEEGKTRIREVYVVSAPIAAKVLRAPHDPGDPVVKGETVVAILQPAAPPFLDTRTRREQEAQAVAARSAVDLAGAEVRQAETELAWAVSELERTRRLAQTSTASQRALERARLDQDKQRAALVRARANLELRRAELMSTEARLVGPAEADAAPLPASSCCVEIRAPASGRVLRKVQDSETVVPPGTALLEIGDPGALEIVVELLSTDAVRVVPGAEATIEGAGLPEPLQARVRRIEPAGFTKVSALGIEEQRVRTLLDLVGPTEAAARLGHEYRVFVRITTWAGEGVLRVPLSALFRRGERWAVFREENGRARTAFVEIGHRNNEFAEVRGGLRGGERIVLHPSDRVAEGVRIASR